MRVFPLPLALRLSAGLLLGASLLCAAPGLVVRYSDQRGSLLQIAPRPAFRLQAAEVPHPALQQTFQATFSGRLQILQGGDYEFFAGPAELLIDASPISGVATLAAGEHDLELTVKRSSGPLTLRLEWRGPRFGREPIAARFFSHDEAAGPAPLRREIEVGRRLVEDLGCVNCHSAPGSSLEMRSAPPLDNAARLETAWVRHWLDSPQQFRPQATMPLMLDDRGRADVAAFLATLGSPPAALPDYSRMYEERGRTTFQSFGCNACHGSGGVSLDGLGSKAGAAHWVELLQDPLRFLPDGRMPSLSLTGDEALELAAYLALSRNEQFESAVPPGNAERGRGILEQSGCLSCHALGGVLNRFAAARLTALEPSGGCLADTPGQTLPRYRLARSQRSAIQAFLVDYKNRPDRSPAPIYQARTLVEKLRCNACHELDGWPASGSTAESPPPLTDVGEKLQSEWLNRVLTAPSDTLPWLELRMPNYAAHHAAVLVDGLAKAAGVEPDQTAPPTSPQARDRGHAMLGVNAASGGLGCIGCHGWGEYPPLGENGPELQTAGKRLRPAWFVRWMRDPIRILSGTSMPNFFLGMPHAEANDKIAALWSAFRAADDLPPPEGFKSAAAVRGSEEMPDPQDRSIVVRWDMPEATTAAIAVGMPGGISYCFDAGVARLRYAWRGGFVDLSPTLFTKKNKQTGLTETAHLVGDIFFREGDAPLRVGQLDRIPQRRFRGYRLVDSNPRFHYLVDGVDVYELITPIDNGFQRRFSLPRVEGKMWFVAPPGANVSTSLGAPDDGRWEIPEGDNIEFQVTVIAP